MVSDGGIRLKGFKFFRNSKSQLQKEQIKKHKKSFCSFISPLSLESLFESKFCNLNQMHANVSQIQILLQFIVRYIRP